jgi:hypothetical protein
MNDILGEVEQMLAEYIIQMCSREEKKDIWNGADVLNALTMDAEEEVKDRIWFLVKGALNWQEVVSKVKDDLALDPESQSESETEDEEEEQEEEED